MILDILLILSALGAIYFFFIYNNNDIEVKNGFRIVFAIVFGIIGICYICSPFMRDYTKTYQFYEKNPTGWYLEDTTYFYEDPLVERKVMYHSYIKFNPDDIIQKSAFMSYRKIYVYRHDFKPDWTYSFLEKKYFNEIEVYRIFSYDKLDGLLQNQAEKLK